MLRSLILSLVLAVSVAGGAGAQPVPGAQAIPRVEVAPLAAPDAFTTPGRDTGLPPTLWTGASVKTVRAVLPLLAVRPLTPAGAQLARRVLATGAVGPEGGRQDPALAAGRARALLMQGDAKAAAAELAHAPGADRNADLAQAVAEADLLAGDDTGACQTAQALTEGRDEPYWLKLRTYCQAIAGETAQAQLTFDLANAQSKDPVFTRLMGAKLAGAGNPGAASLRNGLDYALSRSLGLDVAAAKPAPAVAAALTNADPAPVGLDPTGVALDLQPVAKVFAAGDPVTYGVFMGVMNLTADSKVSPRLQSALLLFLALQGPLSPDGRGELAALTVPEGKAPVGRAMALEVAGQQRLMGEAAMLSLWILADAGPAGPAIGDRVRIVRALHLAGLDADARAIAFEGLQALK